MITRFQSTKSVLLGAATLIAAALIIVSTASAAVSGSGLKISKIEAGGVGLPNNVWIYFSGGTLSGTTCNQRDVLTFDASTTTGKNWLTILTAAYLAGKSVNVNGNTPCTGPSGQQIATLTWLSVY